MKTKLLIILFFFGICTSSFAQFITTWEFTSDNSTIRIPTNSDFTYDYNVDWGDGSTSTNQTGDTDHTFATAGTYTVTITGTFPAIYFNSIERNVNSIDVFSRQRIRSVTQWGNNSWQSMRRAFSGCNQFTITATDTPNLSNVTDMGQMFYNASQMNGDISGWDVSNVTNMGALFSSARNFNQNISGWNVVNVTNMSSLFQSATDFNQDISSWDVSNVTDMRSMFSSASSFNQDISGWNVANVTNMNSMFRTAVAFNQDISGWNVANVTDMNRMFFRSEIFNQPIGSWNVLNVTDMSEMFGSATAFNQDLNSWDVSSVSNMSEMFIDATSFNGNISSWNVSSVTDMSKLFQSARSFNQDISGWNVSNVIDMSGMFSGASIFNQDVNGWNVGNVTNTSRMFSDATNFNQNLANWNVSKVTDMTSMFSEAEAFNQDISSWDTSTVTDMSYMFEDAITFNQNLGNWDVSKVTDMYGMLSGTNVSIQNYDATLNGWASQTVQSDVYFEADNLKYCNSETARTTLTSSPNNWTIIDAGLDCSQNSDYTAIPDANFEQYLVQNNIDSDGQINGEVLTSDIAGITQLDLSQKSISDLTGIQDFSALTYLNVFDNNLTSVDLSQNTLLQYLYLNDNQLTTVDISNNINLIDFGISQNQLTMLDVSNNTELTHLALALNQISSIDISNLTKLIDLRCEANSISSLDVSNNKELETFWCFDNSLTTLNLSGNTKIKELKTHLNQLSSLNLRNNTLLEDFTCNDNILESLDVKNGNNTLIFNFEAYNNPNLACINVDDVAYSTTNWTEIDTQTSFSESCIEGTYIPDANFESYIESQGWGNGINADNYVNTSLIAVVENIDVSNKNISDLTGIEDFVALKTLVARDNQITSLDITNNISLENLDLFNNSISSINVSKNTSLIELSLGNNQLTNLDVSMLNQLTKLWCFNNQLSELFVVNNTKLEVLNCSTNSIETLNLQSNTNLSVLYCDSNQLQNLDLSQSTSLTQLTASSNFLESLSIKNGNTTNINTFFTTNNPALSCIEVDDATWATTNLTNIDNTSSFNEDCAPFNDDCSNAIPLVYNQQTAGDVNSGTANNNPTCAEGTVLADVWFSVVVPTTGEFSIEGTGFGGRLKFAVYQTCSSQNAIACGDAISLTNLTPGTTFYLKVWLEASSGRNSQVDSGSFTLTASESSVLSVSSFENTNTILDIYPNPSSEKINISFQNNQLISKVMLYNLLGKNIMQKKVNNLISESLDVSNLSKGMYLVKIISEGKVYTKKVLVE